MNRTFEYDVLLNHNQANESWVRKLEATLTMILCLSPLALGSDWVRPKHNSLLIRDPSIDGYHFIQHIMSDRVFYDNKKLSKTFLVAVSKTDSTNNQCD